jgi:hypothetical protein
MMKLINVSILISVVAICLGGCGGSGDYSSPKATMETMINAAKAGDQDAMFACYTDETRADFEELQKLASEMGGGMQDIDIAKQLKTATPVLGEEKIDGNKATLAITVDGKQEILNFVKVGGDWKITVPDFKEGIQAMKGVGEMMKNLPENMKEEMGKAMEEAMKGEKDK